jgi:hypothetical protein
MVNIYEPFKCSDDKCKRKDGPFHPRRSPSDIDSPIRNHDIVNWRNREMIYLMPRIACETIVWITGNID